MECGMLLTAIMDDLQDPRTPMDSRVHVEAHVSRVVLPEEIRLRSETTGK